MGEIDELLRHQMRETERFEVHAEAMHSAEVMLLSAIALEAQRIALDSQYPCQRLTALREAYLAVAPIYMDPGADLG